MGSKSRPPWLGLILLFFSPRMVGLWRRVAVGVVLGLLCDAATDLPGGAQRWQDLL